MAATLETFRCMACGHQYQEKVEKGEDKERSCPKCRSNSIRQLKRTDTPRAVGSLATLSTIPLVFALAILLVAPGAGVFASQSVRKRIEPAVGGALSATNSLGDVITLTFPIYALHEPTEVALAEIDTALASPIQSRTFPGVTVSPSGLIFHVPVRLKVRGTREGRDLAGTTLYRLESDSKVMFLPTQQEEDGGISALLHTTSSYLGGVVTFDEFTRQSQLTEEPPDTLRDMAENFFFLEGLAKQLDVLGRPDLAGRIKQGMADRMLRDYQPLLGQPVPADPCTSYFDGLGVLKKNLGYILLPALERMLGGLVPMEAISTEEFGAPDSFGKLSDIAERLGQRIEQIADSCPPLRRWTVSLRRDETGTLDLYPRPGWAVHSTLSGEAVLRIDHLVKGKLRGTDEVTFEGWEVWGSSCEAGKYIADSADYSLDAGLDIETNKLLFAIHRDEHVCFRPRCNITSDWPFMLEVGGCAITSVLPPGDIFSMSFPPESAGGVTLSTNRKTVTFTIRAR